MAQPGYSPLPGQNNQGPALTPQQQYQLMMLLQGTGPKNGGSQPPLTYEQWLAATGKGNPYAPTQNQGPKAPNIDVGKLVAGLTGGGAATAAATSGGALPTIAGSQLGPTLASTVGGDTTLGALGNLGLTSGATDMAIPSVATTSLPGAAAPGMFDLAGIGGAGNAILPAAGLIPIGDVLLNNRGPGRGALEGAAGGAAIGSYFGPWGAAIGGGLGGLVGLGKGLFKHKSTKEYEKERWGDFANKAQASGINPALADIAQNANHPVGDTGIWQTGKYAGQKWDFNKALDLAKSGGNDFNLVLGNMQTFGPEWLNKTPDQQRAVSQALANAGLYKGDHGDVLISDANKAQQIYQQLAANGFKAPTQPQAPSSNPTPIPRSPTGATSGTLNLQPGGQLLGGGPLMINKAPTHNPGFDDKTGKRLNYTR